jgi:hypothetical protein
MFLFPIFLGKSQQYFARPFFSHILKDLGGRCVARNRERFVHCFGQVSQLILVPPDHFRALRRRFARLWRTSVECDRDHEDRTVEYIVSHKFNPPR